MIGTAAIGALGGGCAGAPRPAGRTAAPRSIAPGHVDAVAFDLFTIFDPRSVDARVEAWAPGEGARLSLAWRTRAFEYAWIRAAAGRYTPFREILEDALDLTARAEGRALSDAARREIADAFQELDPWPDAADALEHLRAANLRLITLANYTPTMIESLLGRARLRPLFEHLVSTDAARTYKPGPAAYQLGADALGLPREQIAFSAFGGWDAAGAAWFGYPTFWVNRLGAPHEALGEQPASGPDLHALATWIAARAG